jgi:hypothetical protein
MATTTRPISRSRDTRARELCAPRGGPGAKRRRPPIIFFPFSRFCCSSRERTVSV